MASSASPAVVDAERQIRSMAEFIELEAKEKAAEIRAKAKADADAEKQITVSNAKTKLSDEFDRKEKALAVEQRITASMAEAHQRSRLLAAREAFVQKLAGEARARLGTIASSNGPAYAVLLKGLIKQAILRLEGEKSVEVHARPQDVAIATKAAAAAAAEFVTEAKARGAAAGAAAAAIVVTTISDNSLRDSAGGVMVWALGGRIKCNNTLEARLGTVLHDLTPVIRDVLFPSAKAVDKVKPPVFFAHLAHAAAHPPPPAAPVAPAPPAAAAVAAAGTGADPFAF